MVVNGEEWCKPFQTVLPKLIIMLIGSYLGVLSESRRIAVPKKFINELGERPIIAKWYEDCLIIVSNGFWGGLSERLVGGRKAVDLGIRDIERFILGSAYELEPDEQGRIIVPEMLASYARLTKDAVFVGLVDRVELWPKEEWDLKTTSLEKTTKEYIEKINK
jgi:Uncharacterized protein conserved in bacteria